ncbi:MAG TPA: FecR domain-containing protein [Candidatus Acidoferrum sp.]|nr:FecR domain-containing protein [Candidatus Acidoferrum sp.]
MRDDRQPGLQRHNVSRVEVYWTNVTYRTVLVYALLAIAVIVAVIYVLNPAWVNSAIDHLDRVVSGDDSARGPAAPGQVRFVNLDGAVQVKKVNSVSWSNASLGITLDKGDVIQTGPDGIAKLAFPDGTTYTVKADTLVVVEENSIGRDHATNVSVRVSSGAVDLSTPTWDSPGSKAQVKVADATASMNQNTRAAVRSEAGGTQGEVTVVTGAAQVQQGNQTVSLDKWQKASITTGGNLTKTNVLGPPDLVAPLNLQPLIEPDAKQASIHFEWKKSEEAMEYVLHISSNSTFNTMAVSKHTSGTGVDVTGLDAGEYFWNVVAIGANKQESEPSDTYKFTLVTQGKGQGMLLTLDEPVLHGNVVEIIGRTEPSAALIINGQHVADISPDGRFRFFTEPMTKGSHTIMVTGQNRRGGTNTQSVTIVIP